jgi:FHA domain-containing protein
MGVMRRFEDLVENLVQGAFTRPFSIKEGELAAALVQTMDDKWRDNGQLANEYIISLSRRDYKTLKPRLDAEQANAHPPRDDKERAVTLIGRLQLALRDAAYRKYRQTFSSFPSIFFEEHPRLGNGQVRVLAEVVAVQSQQAGQVTPDPLVEATRAMTPEEAQWLARQAQQPSHPQPAGTLPPAWLTLLRPQRGAPMQITKQTVHIGRNQANDVVVNDKRVSRYHAEVRYEHGQFMLYDLGSTNGVGINGVLTRQPVPLKNGDLIGVGDFVFVFQRR